MKIRLKSPCFFASLFAAFILLFTSPSASSQTGPAGVGTTNGATSLRTWWRADAGVTLTSGAISAWNDQSGYNNHLAQATAGNRPTTVISTALNNRTVVRYVGANSHYFTSSLSGPNVDNITLFLVANGTSYQSLFRFQDAGGTFVVYPWENGGGRVFISSSDGGTATGVASGLVTSANNVGVARYRRNTANGMQTYLNGAVLAQRTSVDAVLPSQPFFSGRYNPGASEYPTADVGELITYYSALNDAQIILIQNYLAAKYNVTLSANDVYTMDNPANGNYDDDVAGIGRVDASNLHADSQGTGIVRILNPTGLGNNEFLVWGHNNQTTAANETVDIPAGLDGRMVRVWRASEVNATGTAVDVGAVDIRFDLTGLGTVNTAHLRLLVDTDNDGTFTDETAISGATSLGSNVYQFAGVTQITNATRFTLATSSHATPLNGVRTFYSLATGDWESNTSWSRTSNGSSGALAVGELPLRTDNVVIRTGHIITVNNVADNGSAGVRPDDLAQANIGPFASSNLFMFYQTGNIVINGTLSVTGIEVMLGGYTEILSGGTLTAGSNLVNTGYLEAASGSNLSTLDDFVLTGNSITWINTNSTSSDDLIIDHTDATLCGTGSTILQNGSGSQITYANGGTINQVCTSFTITCTGVGCAGTFPAVGTTVVISGGNGPGGVGITNGASQLALWLDATRIGAANNATVTTWNDLSGYAFNFTAGTGATYRTNAVNGYSVLEFNGTTNYFQRAFTAGLNPANFSLFSASNVTSTGLYKTIISSRDAGPTRGYMLYSVPTSNLWSFWTGMGGAPSTVTWDQLTATSTAGTWASQSARFNAAVNTKYLSINNGTSVTQTPTFAANTARNTRVGAGNNESTTPDYYFNGRMGEVILYNASTNDAQIILINNYLAAKYNFTLSANDVYTMDNDLGTARDDYDHEVAGIGQAASTAYHRDARGTGIVRIWNANNLGNGEYLMWGHNNATLTATTNTVGTSVDGVIIRERLTREWAVSEIGEVGTVSILFDLTSFSGGFVGSNLRLLIDRDGDGYQDNDVAPTIGSFAGNTIIFSGVNLQTGDRFTLGNTSLTQPLPVTLTTFTATPHESSVLLEWGTSSELNNDYFDVLRSTDAEQWNKIATVRGAGTSHESHYYFTSDEQPLRGVSYYKLKQTDFDGHYSYSAVVRVEFNGTPTLSVSPNPSTGIFDIHNEDEPMVLEVLNTLGQKVPFLVNDTNTQVDLSAQPAGIYFLKVISQGKLKTARLIKN